MDTAKPAPGGLAAIAGSIRAAAALTEERFLDIGQRLETSAGMVGGLTETFGALSGELRSENLQLATRSLSQIADRVPALALALDSRAVSAVAMAHLTETVANRIGCMVKSVNGVGILAMNAKIVGASIDGPGVEFTSFAGGIARTLHLAQTNLGEVTAELGGVGRLLHAAIAAHAALGERQAAAVRVIPLRLEQSVDAVATRGKLAAAAAIAVGQGTQRVGKRIGDAVMALQIGDITRQRIEHVDYAIGLVSGLLAAPDGAQTADQGTCAALGGAQLDALAGFCCGLQSAQLLDMADKLDHGVKQIFELAAGPRGRCARDS